MKLKNTILATILGVTAFSASAVANDSEQKFDGLYGGLELGFDQLRIPDVKEDNIYYGGVLGYRNQLPSGLVTGIEGTFGDNKINLGDLARTKYEWSTALTLGWTMGENSLLYGKLGYAELKGEFDDGVTSFTESDGGLRAGIGFEQALSRSISFRAGVDYTTYGNDLEQWQAKTGLLFKF